MWADYGIGVTVDPDTDAVALSKEDKPGITAVRESPDQPMRASHQLTAEHLIEKCGGYDVGHSASFWIIDRRGVVRIGIADSATPADIVTNVRVLLRLK